ncbi:MAG: ABC transporter permease, partial [Rhodospirillales bacterium]|nr:ABC transporter permease [Rhodospirillales bacterium]
TDSVAVADKMRAMPVNDMYNNNVTIRPDGRVLHMMYLMRVKSPEESRYKDDVYTIVARTPGAQAFRPMSEGGCPLVTG